MADRLWKSEKKKQKKKRNPSPTLKRVETGAAQNQNNTVTGLPLYILFGKRARAAVQRWRPQSFSFRCSYSLF